MKHLYQIILHFSLLFLLMFPAPAFAEGSKEIYIGTYTSYLYLCNDFTTHCQSNGGQRTQFAIYGCNETDRLYFITANSQEILYIGFQILAGQIPGADHAVYRIKDLAGNIVSPETNVPTSGVGYINTITEARNGPFQLYGAGGYSAIDFHPNGAGQYYIEFQVKNNSTGNTYVVPNGFKMFLFDATVYDSVNLQKKLGRVFSKGWQLEEDNNNSATNYVYSNDSIVTSVAFSNMDGGVWVQFCNQWGCANTNNFASDRKSLNNAQAYLPEYKIFLNPPDSTLFPSATTLGQIVAPAPWGESNCDNGYITFHVAVNKTGNVEIDLTFPGPYTTRILTTSVVIGDNLLVWDGKDGSGTNVPDNVLITFTVKYVNGLTNLPLYDVEGNSNGFIIGLVRPAGATPLVYWDDSNISGGTTNFGGCLSPPGCHLWNSSWGDQRTINTWWYNVSTSTAPATIIEHRNPQTLVFNQSSPQNICAGSNNVFFSVTADPNATEYHWSYTGTGTTITQTLLSDNHITIDFATTATSGSIQVYGTNTSCVGNGPTSSLVVNIKPLPSANPPFTKTICSGTSTNWTLSSTPAGSTFSWTTPVPTCSVNIAACPAGLNNQTVINNILSVTDLNPGTVTYHITPTLNSCSGSEQDYTVTVNPLPNIVITSTTPSICSGQTTDILLSSGLAGSSFNWTATGSSPNITGFASSATGDIIQTISNSGFTTGTVTFVITASNTNGCTNPVTSSYIVTVYPIPDLNITSGTTAICSGQTTDIQFSSSVAGAIFNWTATASSPNLTGFAASGAGTISQTITNTGYTTETVTFSITPEANNCQGSISTYIVTVYPSPDLSNTPLSKQQCNNINTNITLTSNVTGTAFTWTATPGSINLSGFSNNSTPATLLDQTLTNSGFTAETVSYLITPLANGCTGNNFSYVVTVFPTPDLSNSPANKQICNNTATGITLTSNVSSATFTWTCTPSSGSVSGFSDNITLTTSLNQILINSGFGIETVTYHITPHANGCDGPVTDYIVTVYPVPDLSTLPLSKQICNNTSPNVLLASDVTGTLFTWTCTPGSGNVTGYSNNGLPVALLDQTLINTGFAIETVTYHITPHANDCDGNITDYVVTVYPTPDLSNNPPAKSICNNAATGITLTSNVTGTLFTWTCTSSSGSVSGFSNSAIPGTSINQTLVNSGYNIETVTYHITPHTNGCDGNVTDYVVTVFPTPDLSNSPPSEQICNNQQTNVTLTSDVSGTLFTWSCTPGSGNVSGYSNNAVPTTILNQTLVNSGFAIETVTYHITPHANGCDGQVTNFVVTLAPKPDLSNSPPVKQICNNAATNVTLISNVNGTLFTWTCTPSSGAVNGYSDIAIPTTLLNQTLANSGYNIETVTYHITPHANGCDGDVTSYIVTVYPTPDLSNTPLNKQICNNASTNTTLTSNVAGTLFTWSCTPSSGSVTGYSNNVTPAVLLNQTLINTGFNIETVTYHITPHANGCTGPVTDYIVTVYPQPDLTNTPLSKQICNNTSTNIPLISNVTGTLFTWTCTPSSVNVSGFSNNTVPTALLDQTLVNSGFAIETVTYHLTPDANGCSGNLYNYVVTVYPTPDLSTSPLAKSSCNNLATGITLTSNVSGTLFTWICTPSSGSVSGFSNSVAPGTLINQTLVNSGFNIETVTYHITPHANGCDGNVSDYVVTVFPNPDLSNNPPSEQICNSQQTNVILTSDVLGTLFTWTCTPSSANVTGYSDNAIPTTILNQTLVNAGVSIETVTYHITPHANGCDGPVTNYIVMLVSKADLSNTPPAKQICDNTATNVTLTSDVPGTLFTWTTTVSSPNVSGYSDNATPTVTLNQTLVNSGYNIEMVTYHVLPHFSGCDGDVTDYTVTVYPTPDISNNPLAKQQCNNSVTNISLTSNVAGTLFTWTCTPSSASVTGYSNNATPTVLLNQTLINSGYNIETVTYHLTPHANGCAGPVSDYVVTVYPTADVYYSPVSLTLCSQQTTNIQILSHVAGTTFTWTASASSGNVSGFSAGNGFTIAQTLTNSGTTIETVTYVGTPTANQCVGTSSNVVVTVNPTPAVTTTPMTQTICSGFTTAITLTSSVAGSTFAWTTTSSSSNLTGYLNGNGPTINQTITNSGFTIETVTYHITPTANGCSGPIANYVVTVNPTPDVSNNPLNSQICSGTSPNIAITSNVANTTFTWTTTPSSANVTGYSNGGGLVINQILTNLGFNNESVTYHITPHANGCTGPMKNFIVTVYPVPDVYFLPTAQTICSNLTTNIQNLSHVAGTTFTWTATPSSGNLSGYSNSSGNLIAQTLFNSGGTIETVIYTVSPVANGCPAGLSHTVVVTVNPRPTITNLITSFNICSATATNIVFVSTVVGTTYIWTASGSSANVTGFANGSGSSIIQTLTNSGFNNETVIYTVTPTANSCTGMQQVFTVTVFPVADVYFTPAGETFCSGGTTSLALASHVAVASFTWTATPSSGNVTGYSNGSGSLIQQTLTNSGYMVETVNYAANPTANGCPGVISHGIATVNPYPTVTLTTCWDPVFTTDAQPVKLKGGVPLGGIYSGTGVNSGTFYPGIAGSGTYTITYTYTNGFNCTKNNSQTITVVSPTAITCGNALFDIRDNQQYPTVQIGTQCWMASNLNYGNTIASSQMQRDNCISEKYCFSDNPANCSNTGGLYQWDELMKFDNNSSAQGLCPPGWHIPTETDWTTLFNFYISNGFAGSPLKYTGYSGFNALLSGVRHLNVVWDFNNFAIMYWTSTSHDANKAWSHGMNSFNPSVSAYPAFRSNAFAVRCIKD